MRGSLMLLPSSTPLEGSLQCPEVGGGGEGREARRGEQQGAEPDLVWGTSEGQRGSVRAEAEEVLAQQKRRRKVTGRDTAGERPTLKAPASASGN